MRMQKCGQNMEQQRTTSYIFTRSMYTRLNSRLIHRRFLRSGGNNIGACGVLVLFCFLVSWRAWLPATFVGCSSVALDRYYVSLCVPLLLALFLYPVLLSLVSRLSVLVLFLSTTPRASGCLQ